MNRCPDELIEPELLRGEEALHAGRIAVRTRWGESLRALLARPSNDGRTPAVAPERKRAVSGSNDFTSRLLRRSRDIRRVGTHVGNETLGAFSTEIDTFVEFLRDLHRAANRVVELARGFLLQRAGGKRR